MLYKQADFQSQKIVSDLPASSTVPLFPGCLKTHKDDTAVPSPEEEETEQDSQTQGLATVNAIYPGTHFFQKKHLLEEKADRLWVSTICLGKNQTDSTKSDSSIYNIPESPTVEDNVKGSTVL